MSHYFRSGDSSALGDGEHPALELLKEGGPCGWDGPDSMPMVLMPEADIIPAGAVAPAFFRYLARDVLPAWVGALLVHSLAVLAILGAPHPAPHVQESPVLMVSLASLGEAGGGSCGSDNPGTEGAGETFETATTADPGQPFETAEIKSDVPQPSQLSGEPIVPLSDTPPEDADKPVQASIVPPEKAAPVPQPQKKPKKVKGHAPKPVRRSAEPPSSPPPSPGSSSAVVETPTAGTGSGPVGAGGQPGGKGVEGSGDSAGGGGSPLREFQLAQVDKPPVIVNRIEPEYPFLARRQSISGKVVVKFLVDREGKVQKPCILKADPKGIFEGCVLDAVGKWRFKPGYLKGQAVSTWVVLPIQFQLKG